MMVCSRFSSSKIAATVMVRTDLMDSMITHNHNQLVELVVWCILISLSLSAPVYLIALYRSDLLFLTNFAIISPRLLVQYLLNIFSVFPLIHPMVGNNDNFLTGILTYEGNIQFRSSTVLADENVAPKKINFSMA